MHIYNIFNNFHNTISTWRNLELTNDKIKDTILIVMIPFLIMMVLTALNMVYAKTYNSVPIVISENAMDNGIEYNSIGVRLFEINKIAHFNENTESLEIQNETLSIISVEPISITIGYILLLFLIIFWYTIITVIKVNKIS